MSLFDIYKAKKLGANTDAFFTTKLGKKMGWITESFPYSKRITANGANVGSVCEDTIIGGSIVWNQLINANVSTSGTKNGITYSSDGNGKVSLSGKATSHTILPAFGTCQEIVKGHKYISTFGDQKVTNGTLYFMVDRWSFAANVGVVFESLVDLSAGKNFEIRVANTYTFDEGFEAFPQLFDLTEIFGSSIADYIYSLEQATSGAGVTYFRKLFPEDYYASAKAIQSVNASARITKDSSNVIVGNYALDESLTLRGIAKLDSSNNLYFDGDTYESNGTVTRLYAERAYQSGDATNGTTMITDGVNTVYKLDTPVTESADPFTNPQSVVKNGTEEYVDYSVSQGLRDVSIPVGHITKYQAAAE